MITGHDGTPSPSTTMPTTAGTSVSASTSGALAAATEIRCMAKE